MFEKVKDYINNVVIKKIGIPYFDLCVYKDHKQIFRYFTGKDLVCGNEKLCMFSMTKPITSVLAMRLIEENKLSLLDDVGDFLPNYNNAFILDKDGNKVNVKITVKHLFTMSAGLNYNLFSPAIMEIKEQTNNAANTVQVANALANDALQFVPGKQFLYSLCLDVLGAIIEVVSGKKLSEYMSEIIFNPLNMKNSTIKHIKNIPYYYASDNKGNIFKTDATVYNNFFISDNYESAGAGLISTVDDYSTFADTLACGGISKTGYRLLKNETINKIKEEQFSSLNIKNNFTCVQGSDYGYGLGMRTRTKKLDCGLPIGEFGWDGAAGSYVMMDTDNSVSIVMGMNVLDWPNVFSGEHLNIVKLIYSDLNIK